MLSRLARRVPSHCASDIAASGTSSGGQTPWFTTRMSSPPSGRAASSTARLAPTGSPRSAWTATVSFRTLPPPTALIVSSASAFLLRYPTATLAPARASISAVARPMPRPPPVTKARFPERSITVLLQRGTRSAERGTAVKGRSPHNAHTFVPLSAFPLPRSRFQALLNHFADQVLDGEMVGVGCAAAVAGEEQRPVGAQCGDVRLGDRRDRLGVLFPNPRRQRRQGGEPRAGLLGGRHSAAAWTSACKSAAEAPGSSSAVPTTTKSAPAARAA